MEYRDRTTSSYPEESSVTNIYSGKLYIIGGEGSETAVNIYNIENDVWSSGAESSIGRKYAYSCVYDNNVSVHLSAVQNMSK